VIGDPAAKPTTLLWGDSHAAALQSVIGEALLERGLAARVATMAGCPPLFDVHRARYDMPCEDFADAVRSAASRGDYRSMILVAYWLEGDDLTDASSSTDMAAVFRRALVRTVSELRALGVEVLVADPLPGARRAVPRALAQRAANRGGYDVAFTREEYLARNSSFFSAINDGLLIPAPGRLALWRELCKTGTCDVASSDGSPLYFDSHHPAWPEFRFAIPFVASAVSGF
jgi:hypothetical protein